MKIRLWIFGLALAAAIMLRWALCSNAIAQGQAGSPSAAIAALLKERSDTLEQNLKLVREQYRNGTVSFEIVAQAEKQLMTSDLDAARTRQERITLLKKNVADATEIENLVKQRYRVGQVTMADTLQAHADSLEARIALLREEQKPAVAK